MHIFRLSAAYHLVQFRSIVVSVQYLIQLPSLHDWHTSSQIDLLLYIIRKLLDAAPSLVIYCLASCKNNLDEFLLKIGPGFFVNSRSDLGPVSEVRERYSHLEGVCRRRARLENLLNISGV